MCLCLRDERYVVSLPNPRTDMVNVVPVSLVLGDIRFRTDRDTALYAGHVYVTPSLP